MAFTETFYYDASDGDLGAWPANRSTNPYFPVFETPVARIGVAICYDRHFEGVIAALAANGAELVLSPAVTFGAKSRRMWDLEFPVDAARHRVTSPAPTARASSCRGPSRTSAPATSPAPPASCPPFPRRPSSSSPTSTSPPSPAPTFLVRQGQPGPPGPQNGNLAPQIDIHRHIRRERGHLRGQIPFQRLPRRGRIGPRQIVENRRHPVQKCLGLFQRGDHTGKSRGRFIRRDCRDPRPRVGQCRRKSRGEIVIGQRGKGRQAERAIKSGPTVGSA